jgi:ABC-type nickel/cobalt efflux system permease component RcnA
MLGLSLMQMLQVAWGGVTVVLVFLMGHRLMLGIHEDDELFLEASKSVMEREQAVNTRRINAATPWINAMLAIWAVLLVGMVGYWIYTGLY